MADPLAVVAIASSLVSGAVGFIGAQRQASALKDQAKQAELMGEYNAQIERNNAIAEANDANFQASVEQYNKQSAIQQREHIYRQKDRKLKHSLASLKTTAARRGMEGESLDAILETEAMIANDETMEIFRQGSERSYQHGTQADLSRARGNRAIELGRTRSTMARLSGQNRASALRSRSDSARFSGYGQLVSGIGTAANIGYQAHRDGVFG